MHLLSFAWADIKLIAHGPSNQRRAYIWWKITKAATETEITCTFTDNALRNSQTFLFQCVCDLDFHLLLSAKSTLSRQLWNIHTENNYPAI